MQLTITGFRLGDRGAWLTALLPDRHGGWPFDFLVIGHETTKCLSEHWFASRQVEARDGAAAGSVPEHLRNYRFGDAALEQGGGHGAPQVVGAQAPVAGAALPAADQRGDVAAAALHNALVDIGNRLAAIESSLRQAPENGKQVVADRHPTQAALAAHAQQLAALVDVLEAKAGKLSATNAAMRERFEDIRKALRGAARARAVDWTAEYPRRLADALDQVERLLPPEDVGPVVLSGESGDASERSEES